MDRLLELQLEHGTITTREALSQLEKDSTEYKELQEEIVRPIKDVIIHSIEITDDNTFWDLTRDFQRVLDKYGIKNSSYMRKEDKSTLDSITKKFTEHINTGTDYKCESGNLFKFSVLNNYIND
jgi:hypothetical protein